MSQNDTTALPSAPLARAWRRWRFHLNALLVVIPLVFMSLYFENQARARGLLGLGEREIGEIGVGPWTARLAEHDLGGPHDEGKYGFHKVFVVAFCQACLPEIKAAYLRVGRPHGLRSAGALLAGNPYAQEAEVVIPPRAAPDSALWLTVEGWDGRVHQASISLDQASPDTRAWLEQRGDR